MFQLTFWSYLSTHKHSVVYGWKKQHPRFHSSRYKFHKSHPQPSSDSPHDLNRKVSADIIWHYHQMNVVHVILQIITSIPSVVTFISIWLSSLSSFSVGRFNIVTHKFGGKAYLSPKHTERQASSVRLDPYCFHYVGRHLPWRLVMDLGPILERHNAFQWDLAAWRAAWRSVCLYP